MKIEKGDTVSFDYSKVTFKDSIKVGLDEAPLKIVEYINLRCPHSKNYEEEIAPILTQYIEEGKVQRILKHFDKEKYPLEVGNVLNQYLDYETQDETYQLMKTFFKNQDIWGNYRLAEIPHYAHIKGLTLQENNRKKSERISKEVIEANVEFIPTIFVGEKAFVESIEQDELKKTIEDQL